ncbi:hypothetical protein AYO41_01610 [Verrucomicrobia bacterium SCGC AG-212-E04]|nr:hypothetical protein AYO41_01610 [Verrucomicrobia bacterium SCGC AG-212-E04]
MNERQDLADTIVSLKHEFPAARHLVVDNVSTSDTLGRLEREGIETIRERRRGTALALLAALPAIESELVILILSPEMASPDVARGLVEIQERQQADFVVVVRCGPEGFPVPGLETGSRIYGWAVQAVFGQAPRDYYGGVYLLSRFAYQNIPILNRGYDLELELVVQVLDKGFRLAEVSCPMPDTSAVPARRSTWSDRFRALVYGVKLLQDYNPMRFYGSLAGIALLMGLLVGSIPIYEFINFGVVRRLSMPGLAVGLVVVSAIALQVGLMLRTSMRARRETYQTHLRRLSEAKK